MQLGLPLLTSMITAIKLTLASLYGLWNGRGSPSLTQKKDVAPPRVHFKLCFWEQFSATSGTISTSLEVNLQSNSGLRVHPFSSIVLCWSLILQIRYLTIITPSFALLICLPSGSNAHQLQPLLQSFCKSILLPRLLCCLPYPRSSSSKITLPTELVLPLCIRTSAQFFYAAGVPTSFHPRSSQLPHALISCAHYKKSLTSTLLFLSASSL